MYGSYSITRINEVQYSLWAMTRVKSTFALQKSMLAESLVASSNQMEHGYVPADGSTPSIHVTDLSPAPSNVNFVILSAKSRITFMRSTIMQFIFAESTFIGKHATYQYTKNRTNSNMLDLMSILKILRHSIIAKNAVNIANTTALSRHPQNEHETSHGSMSQTEWVIEGDDDATLELEGRKYATGDSGAPMLCSMLCKTLGRHAHIDTCRADDPANCSDAGVEHIKQKNGPGNHDWITHRLFWARSGDEHDKDTNPNAVASYCTLPLFHGPADAADAPPLGHISQDGHAYNCKNPAEMQRSFHMLEATNKIVQKADNRFGAVISSIYGFWTARETAVRAGAKNGMRRDAYSIITFESSASVTISNDTSSDPDQLLDLILNNANYYGGTNFTRAIETIQQQMEDTWSTERSVSTRPILLI
ncbi:2166_t:CDS:2 [Acaulospora colombiana]|uniref:2166_t:CDS:1 n=1 Tax=Acaulospora colombiana TaxID=27376 RepID=A0ACA9LXT0_9GLOM|nr:2166_t:CDS:2 [Acaulospora colombiana]